MVTLGVWMFCTLAWRWRSAFFLSGLLAPLIGMRTVLSWIPPFLAVIPAILLVVCSPAGLLLVWRQGVFNGVDQKTFVGAGYRTLHPVEHIYTSYKDIFLNLQDETAMSLPCAPPSVHFENTAKRKKRHFLNLRITIYENSSTLSNIEVFFFF